MGYALWTFLVLPDGAVERYPQNRHQKFFAGELPVGAAVGREARFIELALETRRGHPLRMVRAWFARYELTAEGFLSADHRDRMLHDAAAAADAVVSGGRDNDVLSLDPVMARRRLRLEHSWHPDRTELQDIVLAINDHAAKELVATDGVKLFPLC